MTAEEKLELELYRLLDKYMPRPDVATDVVKEILKLVDDYVDELQKDW